jgi:two-component system, chemotaxis family, chemotaxis protein CheY
MKILTVDDSASIRHLVRTMLQVVGASVTEAGDGIAALKVLETDPLYDLILLDMEMPRMDGMTFLEHIKADARYSKIPVIVVSSISQKERMIRAIQEGAKQYLLKPFTSEDLLTKIVDALQLAGGDA